MLDEPDVYLRQRCSAAGINDPARDTGRLCLLRTRRCGKAKQHSRYQAEF